VVFMGLVVVTHPPQVPIILLEIPWAEEPQ